MRTLSVTEPFGKALSRVGTVLFQPFDIGKWFIIGFCAWLAYLLEGGGFHGGGNFGGGRGHGAQQARAELEQAKDFVLNNIGWIAPLAIGILLVFFAIWLVVLWLSSRGKFMFLHCVARNVAEVRVPWYQYAAEANSLFLFRAVLAFIGTILFLPLVVGGFALGLGMFLAGTFKVAGVMVLACMTLVAVVLGIVFWIIGRLLRDFVVPIQYLRRSRCLDAWRELRGVLSGHAWNVVLYLLFRILLAIGSAAVVFILVVATCCIACCLMMIPYLGTVLLLPLLVLERAYSLHYLAQFGPDYDVFSPPAAAVPDSGL